MHTAFHQAIHVLLFAFNDVHSVNAAETEVFPELFVAAPLRRNVLVRSDLFVNSETCRSLAK